MEFIAFFLQQLPLLLSMLTTMWVAVKRCPLFTRGGIVAIIALFLSLFVATTPIVASPAFGAIDHIELAHANSGIIPIKPEGRIKERHIPPRLVKSGGQWRTTSSMHWFSDEKPVSLMLPPNLRGDIVVKAVIVAALIAVTIDGATMPPPGGVLDGMAMMSSIILSRSSGNKSSLIKFFGGGVAITGYGFSPKAVWRALMKLQNPELSRLPETAPEFNPPCKPEISFCYEFPTFRDLKAVSGRDIIRIDFEGVDADEIFQLFEGKKYFPIAFADRVTVLLGCDYDDVKECYSVEYGDKISKYLKELVPHRPNWVELDPSEVDLIQGPASGLDQPEDDGGSIIAGPKHIIKDVFGEMPTNARGCGVRIYGMELDKSRARILVDNSLERLTIFSHEDNNKGTMGRLVGEGLLMTFWFYNQKGKAATSGPQGLSQIIGRWGDMVRECALASIWRNAHATLGAFRVGALDEGMLLSDERKAKLGHALRCRQDLVERIMLIALPLAISSNLLMLMKNLIRDWRKPTRAFLTAAKEWNTELCHSFSGISCSLSLRKMLGSISKVLLGKKVWWSEKTREIIICNSLWRELKRLAPKTDIGDIDGDMVFLWKVYDQKRGRMIVLLSRHPIGLGGFVVLELDEVDVPWEFTHWTDKDGVVHAIDPITITYLPTSDEYDWVEAGSDLVDADRPANGKIKDADAWNSVFEYEYKKSQAAPGLGKAINAMTLMVMHDKSFKPISTETLADYSQSLAGNVLQMKDLSQKANAIQPKMKDFGQVEKAAVAKFGLQVMNDQGEMVVEVVEGSFTRLINAVVNETKEAHRWLCEQIDFTVNGRNHQVLIDRCLEAGLRPNMEAGKALCGKLGLNAKGSVTDGGAAIARAMKDIDAKPLNEAAAIVLGAYIYMCEKGVYDAGLTYFHAETLSLSEDCLLGYVVRFLEGSDNQPEDNDDNNPEGPNPEGDGPSTETTESQETKSVDESIQLEALSSMKMDELKQICRDAGLKGWSKLKKNDLVRFIIDNTDDDGDDDDNNPTPPNGGGDNPKKGDGMSQEEDWSVVEQICREAREKAEKLSVEQLRDFIQQRKEDLSETGFKAAMSCSSKEELVQFVVDGCLHVWDTEDIPTPPNGGGDRPKTETEAEAAVRIFEAMMPQILEEKAEYEAQKKKEAKMAKKKTALIAEWVEAGKKVQLKQNNQGIYFFVVDHGMRWIPRSILSEEDSKDLNKVREVYGQGRKMFNQGVVGTLFKSLGLAALLFAALLGHEEGVAMYDMASICFLTQEWNKVSRRILHAVKCLAGAERDYDRAVSEEYPKDIIRDRAGMVDLYEKELNREMASLKEVEHAMDDQSLDEVHGKGWQSKQTRARWTTRCGASQKHWTVTHPECRPGTCLRSHEPVIGKKGYIKVWWK